MRTLRPSLCSGSGGTGSRIRNCYRERGRRRPVTGRDVPEEKGSPSVFRALRLSREFSEGNTETLAEAYFCGTKIILFVENAADYDRVLSVFESAFRTPNLQADRSGVSIGRKNWMETEEYLSEVRRGFRGCRSRENKWELRQT